MKRCIFFLFSCLMLFTAGCGAPTVGDVGASTQFFAMNTIMTISAGSVQDEAAVQAARSEIDRLERLLSRTREDSALSLLNRRAGDGTAIPIEPELLGLLQFSKDIGTLTEGALSVTVAPMMDAWGFTADQFRIPTQPEIDALLPLVDDEKLLLDATAITAQLTDSDMKVDLGAVAKGFAAGRATDALRAAGCSSALLDLGGNITAMGTKPDGTPWRVAVKNPQDSATYFCILPLTDRTASTSGGYERYFEENGVRYHHIIDPATGHPADSGLRSVTVVAQDPTLADALSTSLFVLGTDRALELWRADDRFDLILCGTDDVILVTEGLEDGFTFRGEEYGYTYEIVRR